MSAGRVVVMVSPMDRAGADYQSGADPRLHREGRTAVALHSGALPLQRYGPGRTGHQGARQPVGGVCRATPVLPTGALSGVRSR
ncbi:hypothetical protein GCM10009722_08210 [Williamsia deligens]